MATLLGKEVVVGEPEEYKGEMYVQIDVVSSYDNGNQFHKPRNIPMSLIPDLTAKLNALVARLS